MKHTTFVLVGLLTMVISSPVFAVGENTVTSKSYVDAQDALKQDAIPEGTEGSVVIYDGTDENGQTQFDEVGIYDGSASYTNADADKLVTAEVVHDFAAAVENITIADNTLTPVNSDGTACSGNACNLWQITNNTVALTAAGTFAPLTAAAVAAGNKPYGAQCSEGSECVSGVCGKGGKCGCADNTECGLNGVCQGGLCAYLNP